MKLIDIKPIINKKNGQINVSIPKKSLSKKQLNDINDKKRMRIFLTGRKL